MYILAGWEILRDEKLTLCVYENTVMIKVLLFKKNSNFYNANIFVIY